jgi:hypothetical protein
VLQLNVSESQCQQRQSSGQRMSAKISWDDKIICLEVTRSKLSRYMVTLHSYDLVIVSCKARYRMNRQ